MANSTPTRTTPTSIVNIATGYMAAKQLFTASRIGLFAALTDSPATVEQLAERVETPHRVVRILADCMSALHLLHREDGRYRLTDEAAAYLTGAHADLDLAPFLRFLNEISYGHWQQFDSTADSGEAGELAMDDGRWSIFMSGVMTYNSLHAKMLANALDFGEFADILDLGGLSSAFAIEALRAAEHARASLVFDPAFVDSVRDDVSAAGLSPRCEVLGAAPDAAQPEGEFDLVMLNHVVHRFDATRNIEILRNARAAAKHGARLVLLDFFLDTDSDQRDLDALHAAEYLVIDGTVVYPQDEVQQWLARTGWKPVDRITLPGSPRALLAEAI